MRNGSEKKMFYSENIHEGRSMLKHIMTKCQVVNYVKQGNFEWNTDLIETKKLEN